MGFSSSALASGAMSLLLGHTIYDAVRGGVRYAARDTTDDVIVRLMAYGWRPPSAQRPPEVQEILRHDARQAGR